VYWIQSLRPMVEKILSLCVTCQKLTRKPMQPIMGPFAPGAIPLGKLLPFRYISADFAGPFTIVIGRQHHERFVLIYICQQTRAVHAEVTESLLLDHIKNAFTRIFSRRGVPETMRTDNGPSLVAFRTQLWTDPRQKDLFERLKNIDWLGLREFGGQVGIREWEFSPPLAPNFNGLAESAVRIWKKAFQNKFRKQTLRLDEFLTATALAEDIINGRPLDYSDGKLYTPNHLILRGPPQEALPIINPDHVRTLAMRYQLLEDLLNGIWDDFHQGWLYQAQRLPKWQSYKKNVEPGTMVLMFNEDKLKSTRNQWDVGRIVSVTLGSDKQARKAIVAVERPQNTKKEYNLVTHLRSVNKLVPIDLISDQVARILPVDLSKYPLVETDDTMEELATERILTTEELIPGDLAADQVAKISLDDVPVDIVEDQVVKILPVNLSQCPQVETDDIVEELATKRILSQEDEVVDEIINENDLRQPKSEQQSMTFKRVSSTDHHGE
jgi:hypothetical protein